MHLKSEDRTIGQKSFANVSSSKAVMDFQEKRGVNRRDFLKGSAAAGAVTAVTFGGAWFGYKSITERLRVGIIGTGDEGGVLIGALNPDYIDVVAIADIRPYNVHRAFEGDESSPNAAKARPGLMAKYGWKSRAQAEQHVKVYKDRYQDLLADPKVEAVIIVLPLWLHARAAVDAMKAGKHVLTEKLMGHSVHECKEMGRLSYQYGRLLATGHQRHYSVLYENAVDLIRMGLIGNVHHIRAQWHRNNQPGNDSWSPPLPHEIFDDKKNAKVANRAKEIKDMQEELAMLTTKDGQAIRNKLKVSGKSLEKNLRARLDVLLREEKVDRLRAMDSVVNAKQYKYEDMQLPDRHRSALEELIRWRLWDRTGGGLMAELGSHQLDASGIFCSATRTDGHKALPLTVTAVGGRSLFPHDRDCDDHVYCIYEYPGPKYYKDYDQRLVGDPNNIIGVTYSSINGNVFGGYGECVMGTKGTLILEQEQEAMLFSDKGAATEVKVTEGKTGPVLDTTQSGPPQAAQSVSPLGEVSKGYREEIEHWAWCVRNFDQKAYQEKKDQYENNPRCHPKVAMADAIIALTTNLAIKRGERIAFKSAWFDIDSDETPEGNKPELTKYDRPA
jgi:predicted dehydrogenase